MSVITLFITYRYFIDEDVLGRVPSVFFLLSGCYAVMQVIAACLICNPPAVDTPDVSGEKESLVQSEPERWETHTRTLKYILRVA